MISILVGAVLLGILWVWMPGILLGAVSLGLLWAVMVIGVYLTYRILDLADLSVEGTLPLGAAVAARMITGGVNPWLATFCALLAGVLGGLITGLLHTRLKIPALLSGILTMLAMWSINLRVMGGSTGRSNAPLLRVETVYTALMNLGLDKTAASLAVGTLFVIGTALVIYWFFGTELGSAIRATGSNPSMVRAQGVDTRSTIILGLMISNGLVALSGALISQYQGYYDVQMGVGSIVIGLASLIIGEVIFGARSFKNSLISVILGAVAYRIIIALVLKAGMNSNDLKLFTSITVAACLYLPSFRSYLRTLGKSVKSPGKETA
ncbi:hypothetical protein SDC9_84806 [bioreactor metagenome]|uniref:ABC transporter permease n=1 Tax=bioreactor metagenome TaxID=1076179 RepID=A0A644ZBS5_9ZZZZ